jgi:hypothetical protein
MKTFRILIIGVLCAMLVNGNAIAKPHKHHAKRHMVHSVIQTAPTVPIVLTAGNSDPMPSRPAPSVVQDLRTQVGEIIADMLASGSISSIIPFHLTGSGLTLAGGSVTAINQSFTIANEANVVLQGVAAFNNSAASASNPQVFVQWLRQPGNIPMGSFTFQQSQAGTTAGLFTLVPVFAPVSNTVNKSMAAGSYSVIVTLSESNGAANDAWTVDFALQTVFR